MLYVLLASKYTAYVLMHLMLFIQNLVIELIDLIIFCILGTQSRVAPHQKWFGNTRVVKQDALQMFQEEMKKVKSNPYQVN